VFFLGFSLSGVILYLPLFSVTRRYGGPGSDGRTDFGCFGYSMTLVINQLNAQILVL